MHIYRKHTLAIISKAHIGAINPKTYHHYYQYALIQLFNFTSIIQALLLFLLLLYNLLL